MKTKIGIAFVAFGAAVIIVFAVLIGLRIIPDLGLWMTYIVGIAVLCIVVPLNFRANREDEYHDALQNVAQAKRALKKIQSGKKMDTFRLQAVRKELDETSICFRDVVMEKEIYELLPVLEKLENASDHYLSGENLYAVLDEETIQTDLLLLEITEKELLKLREQDTKKEKKK